MKLKSVPYGSPKYWNERYKAETCGFEWYPGADETLCKAFKEHLPGIGREAGSESVLEIGSGSSELAYKLWQCSSSSIIVTDISATVIETMKHKWKDQTETSIQFAVVDCCKIPCRESSFEAVVDKGTLDAIDCTDDRNTNLCLSEVHRVLRSGGLYFLVSCREPGVRRQDVHDLFDILSIVEVRSNPDLKLPCPDAYLYIMKKVNAAAH